MPNLSYSSFLGNGCTVKTGTKVPDNVGKAWDGLMTLSVSGESPSLCGRLSHRVQSDSDVPPWSTQILPCHKDNYSLIKVLICFLQKDISSALLEQGRVTAVHKTIVHVEHILVITITLKVCFDSLNAWKEGAW